MKTVLIGGIEVMLVILATLAPLLTQPPAQPPTPTTSPTSSPLADIHDAADHHADDA